MRMVVVLVLQYVMADARALAGWAIVPLLVMAGAAVSMVLVYYYRGRAGGAHQRTTEGRVYFVLDRINWFPQSASWHANVWFFLQPKIINNVCIVSSRIWLIACFFTFLHDCVVVTIGTTTVQSMLATMQQFVDRTTDDKQIKYDIRKYI